MKALNSNFVEKNSQSNFLSKYKFNFNSQIINNEIFIYPLSEDSFRISIIFENYEIKQIEFNTKFPEKEKVESLTKFQVREGSISSDKTNKITSIDHIYYNPNDKKDFFAFGSSNGNINFFEISYELNNLLKIANLKEIRYDADYTGEQGNFHNPFNFNIKQKLSNFFAIKPTASAIKCIKYLKDNLICYVTEDKNFKIFNQFTNREVYANDKLLGNINLEEKIFDCKIAFLDYDTSRNFFLESRSKILFFCIYFEFEGTFYLNVFELQFLNIPLSNEVIIVNNDRNVSYNTFCLSDYGNTIRFNKNKIIKLRGKLIDLKTIKDKFWSISRKSQENDINEESLFSRYEIKVLNTFKSQTEDENELNENSDNIHNNNSAIGQNTHTSKNKENDEKEYFFNHYNQEIILLDSKLKNFALKIKQISLIKNEKLRNKSLYRLLCNSETIISNDQLINFNKKFVENNASQLANNTTSQSRNYLREMEMKKELVNRTAILKQIFNDCLETNNLITFINNLILESFSNEIISVGYIKNRNLDSICILRNNGIGYLRKIWDFQKINEIIHLHESNIREFIFSEKNLEKYKSQLINRYTLKEMRLLKNKILNYIGEQNQVSDENILFICFALFRILLAENFIKINDYHYFVDYFNDENEKKNFSDFINTHFGEFSQRENSLLFLDIFNSIISAVVKNNVNSFGYNIKELLEKFDNYKNSNLADKISKFSKDENMIICDRSSDMNANLTNKGSFKFNYKFCEIIKKITQDKIEALFFISRDLLSLLKWIEIYQPNLFIHKKNDFEASGKIKKYNLSN